MVCDSLFTTSLLQVVNSHVASWLSIVAKPADIWSCKCKFFCVYRPYKESISKEMNNDDLNLHLHDQMSGWPCHWLSNL